MDIYNVIFFDKANRKIEYVFNNVRDKIFDLERQCDKKEETQENYTVKVISKERRKIKTNFWRSIVGI